MKYFTPELWAGVNHENEMIRNTAADKWAANYEEYEKNFLAIKYKFSKAFLKIYEKNEKFHDWYLEGFGFYNTFDQKKDRFFLTLSDGQQVLQMIFHNVKNLNIKICPAETFALYKKDQYAYDEWLLTEDEMLHFELLLLSLSTIEIVCSHVQIATIGKASFK